MRRSKHYLVLKDGSLDIECHADVEEFAFLVSSPVEIKPVLGQDEAEIVGLRNE